MSRSQNSAAIHAAAVVMVAIIAHSSAQAQDTAARPFTVDDLLSIEELNPTAPAPTVVPSPDGEWVAVVVSRSRSVGEVYQQLLVFGASRSDVWLVRSDGSERVNITRGATDGASYWNPVWSPDGRSLAMLSTQGGDNVRAYVWRHDTHALTRVSERGIDLVCITSAGGGYSTISPLLWISSTQLLVPVVPAGHHSVFFNLTANGARAPSLQWDRAVRGLQPTASVLESGPDLPEPPPAHGQLLVVDVVSGRELASVDIPLDETTSGFRFYVLSPSRTAVAVITRVTQRPLAAQRLTLAGTRQMLGIVRLSEKPSARWIEGLDITIDDQLRHVVRWSPTGRKLAVLARRVDGDTTLQLFSISTDDSGVRQLLPSGWDGVDRVLVREHFFDRANVVWTSRDEPVVLAKPSSGSQRFDWWHFSHSRKPRSLTASLSVVPGTLLRTTQRDRLVGLAAGALWQLDVDGNGATNLTRGFAPTVSAIVWPRADDAPDLSVNQLVVETVGDPAHLYRLDLAHGGAVPESLASAPSAGSIAGYVPSSRTLLFAEANRRLWALPPGHHAPVTLLSLNSRLDEVSEPRIVTIRYRGADGDTLKGLVLLPFGYDSSRRYPLITDAYAGWVIADTSGSSISASKYDPYFLNPMLLAAHGYAVLYPSIPLPPWGQASDPLIDLPKGVLPAVDRAVELGIADPTRLGVMGVSYGGYSTYALVTYTHRFKAAVSIAGMANLVSQYGTFWAQNRYRPDAHITLADPKRQEAGQQRMGAAPWVDLWRYLKNSPIYYVDRVTTPLLIIQGDMDFIPIQQGEEFFTALYRQRKPAQFVRYWGEWHALDSPANIRDMWTRMIAWFDGHLKAPQHTVTDSSKLTSSPSR